MCLVSPSHAERGNPVGTGPIQIIVSVGRQTLSIYRSETLIETVSVSTGTGGHPTPMGVFTILDKEWQHYSNIYGGASMPFMQRLTMSGVALHSGQVTGRPASHGCIRLPHAFARRLFGMTKLGARVIVAPDDPAVGDISHPRLFAPMRGAERPVALTPVALREAGPATIEPKKGAATLEREAALQAMPVSVFVSREAGKVFPASVSPIRR